MREANTLAHCWIAFTLVERLQLIAACSLDSTCIASCQQATPSGPCIRSTCDSTYSKCRCGDDAALLITGGCEPAPPIVVGGCQLGYSAYIITAVTASPELQQGDLSSGGHASAALITILRRCMAFALGRQANEVVSRSVALSASRRLDQRFLSSGANFSNSQSNVVLADIVFSFCTGLPALQLGSLSAGSFDSSFANEASRYAAFDTGTVRVHQITSTDSTTTTTTLLQSSPPSSSDNNDEDGLFDGSVYTVLFIVLLVLLLIAIIAFWIWQFLRLHKSGETLVEAISLTPGDGSMLNIPRVTANVPFRVEDLNLPEGSDIQALSLNEGDVLEVMLNAGEWLFGRQAKNPDESGYFPESYVSWWGRPISAEFQATRSLNSALPETIGLPAGVESNLREVGRQPATDERARNEGSGPPPPTVRAPPVPPSSETTRERGAVLSRAPTTTTMLGDDGVSTSRVPQSVGLGASSGSTSPRLIVEPLRAAASNMGPVPVFNLGSSTSQSSTVRHGFDVEDTTAFSNSRPTFGGERLSEGPMSLEKSPSFSDMLEELTASVAPTPPEPPPALLVTSPSFSEIEPHTANVDVDDVPRSPPSNFSFGMN